jgi:hypothetical protein
MGTVPPLGIFVAVEKEGTRFSASANDDLSTRVSPVRER